MLYSRIITGIIFFTVLFAQADKGREQSQSIPKKFKDGFILEPVKNQIQFQNKFNSDEIVNISGQAGITAYSADNEAIPLGEPVHRVFSNNSRSVVDTLDNGTAGTVNFGFFPGDVMMEVYQAPTDLIMYGVGVDVYIWNSDGTTPSLKVEVWRPGTGGYPNLSDGTTYPNSLVDGAGWVGYAHPADNDTIHYPDTSYVDGLVWNGFVNGGTCDNDPEPTHGQPLMGTKVLPTGLVDYTITNPDDGSTGLYWVDWTPIGGATFNSGEYIAIVITYMEAGAGDPSNDDTRIGLLSGDASAMYPYPSTKFYNQDCGGTSGNHGWHIRHYNWRFAYAVELTGDRGPIFEEVSELNAAISTESRTVTAQITDDNPSGGDAGVASAQIIYQLDSLTAQINIVNMTLISGDIENGIWEGEIPGQDPWTSIYYYYRAVDVNGNVAETEQRSYIIFEPSSNELIFFNQNLGYGIGPPWGMDLIRLYFYWDRNDFDVWPASNGPLIDELLQQYDVLIELTGGDGPIYNNDDEIYEWWDVDKTYIAAGDEWLSSREGWSWHLYNLVAREILGIYGIYMDINYSTTGDQGGISRLIPDSVGVTSVLYDFLSDSLLLNYDPDYETGNNNWLDGFYSVLDGYTVDMTAYSGVLDSADQVDPPAGSEIYNVMVHGQAENGGKSALLCFDPIALNTVPSYYWVGASYYWSVIVGNSILPYDASPLIAVYELLKGSVSVDDDIAGTPNAFSLIGNYPNPFNPVTNIHYELHENTHVEITIYDVLGREVKKLVSGELVSGYHKTIWDATNDHGKQVSAGVYLYQIQAGGFVQTKKMVLLK